MFSGNIMLSLESLKFDETNKVINKMRTNAKTTKYSNLENLISEVLFKDGEVVQNETLKSFLKFKLDLEEYETNKFISHLKKIYPNVNNQYTIKQLIASIKNEGGLDFPNPFENNIFSEMTRKKSFEYDSSRNNIK